jgi:hypothetical protein
MISNGCSACKEEVTAGGLGVDVVISQNELCTRKTIVGAET